jgi:hypothetical protein
MNTIVAFEAVSVDGYAAGPDEAFRVGAVRYGPVGLARAHHRLDKRLQPQAEGDHHAEACR